MAKTKVVGLTPTRPTYAHQNTIKICHALCHQTGTTERQTKDSTSQQPSGDYFLSGDIEFGAVANRAGLNRQLY